MVTISRPCIECEQRMPGEALFCPWCGHQVETAAGLAPTVTARPTSPGLERSALVAYGAAAALIVGSFLPWVKLVAPFVGTITKSGTEGSDGWLTVAVGVVVVVLALRPASQAIGVAMLVASGLAVVLLAYEYSDIARRMSDVRDASGLVSTSYGVGLYLATAGAVAGFVAGAIVLMRPTSSD